MIAVTAVSSRLGRAIASEAISKTGKDNVVGIVRKPEKAQFLGIEIRKGAYTSHTELATADGNLLVDDGHNGQIYNLCGPSVTQQELTAMFNTVLDQTLAYEPVSIEAYRQDRIQAHGEHLGTIIAGIYEGIRQGAFDISSDFKTAAGRDHLSLKAMVEQYR